MPDPFYQIFKKPSDHNDWDKQIEFYTKSTEITDDRRMRILEALDYLRKHLSKGFLKSTKRKHPVKNGIANKATHSIDWLIWLHESLSALEHDQENSDILLKKIVPVKRSAKEGIPFLEVASPLQKNGFAVIFEPQIIGFRKKPDLKITNLENNETIYIEVSTVNESDKRELVMSNYLYFKSLMEGRGVSFAGRVYERLSREDLVKVSAQINTLITACMEDDKMKVLTLEQAESKLELAVAYELEVDKLEKWIESKDLRKGEVESKGITFAEDIYRITNNKIREEAKQIPRGNLGFIYLKVNPLLFITQNILDIISDIQIKLSCCDDKNDYSNIVGLVLWSDVGGKCEPFGLKFGANFYNEFPIFGINKRMTLFVFNEACKLKISVNSLHKIIASMETN